MDISKMWFMGLLLATFTLNSMVRCLEGVVSDLSVIHSPLGIELDLSYNESSMGDVKSGIPSADGCPRSIKSFPWMYFGNPPRCYLVGTTGPCPPGQLFFGSEPLSFGQCDCVCSNNIVSTRKMRFITAAVIPEQSSGFRFCTHPKNSGINEAVLDYETGQCIFLETQGNCQRGQWMVKNEYGNGTVCIPECSFTSGPHSTHYFNYVTSQCVEKVDTPSSQPVSLAGSVNQRSCEENEMFSKLLKKCITKSAGFFMKM